MGRSASAIAPSSSSRPSANQRVVRLGLAIDQADAELLRQRVHVGMIGVDELAADLERLAAWGSVGEHPPPHSAARLVEMRVDPGLREMVERSEPGDAAADDPDAAAGEGMRGSRQRGDGAGRHDRLEQGAPSQRGRTGQRRGVARGGEIAPPRRFERAPQRAVTPHSLLPNPRGA